MSRYVNPFTDFGFKRLFGEEPSKDLLICFLNELLRGTQEIKDLTYLKTEQLGDTRLDRKAIFDLYCENEKGEKFIVELQKARQAFFKDRTIFYSTFPIREQAMPNDWDFRLRPVYTIAIMDFIFEEREQYADIYRHDIQLRHGVTKEVFYDKLTFIYLEMPKFNKEEEELETDFEKWLYAFKHLSELDSVPERLKGLMFERFFARAEIAQFNRNELRSYENSLKVYRDWKNVLDTAHDDGYKEGKEEGFEKGYGEGIERGMQEGIEKGIEKGKLAERSEMAKRLLAKGFSIEEVAELSGLSAEQVASLA